MFTISPALLDTGFMVWRKRNWPGDFHNALYARLDRHRQEGMEQLWDVCLDSLSSWQAFRPLSKAMIVEREGSARRMERLTKHYALVRQKYGNADLTACTWDDIKKLFFAAASIKGVRSPVFGSKLSHMLAPSLFPVIDRAAIGIPADGYAGYWSRCQRAWKTSTCQDELQKRLRAKIDATITPSYPWASKITELCSIGAHYHQTHPSVSASYPLITKAHIL